MTETLEGATYRRHAFLLGFLTKAETDAIFASNPLRLPGNANVAEAYQTARAARNALAGFDPGPLVKDFLTPAAASVLMRATVNVYRLIAQVEEIQAPALTLPLAAGS